MASARALAAVGGAAARIVAVPTGASCVRRVAIYDDKLRSGSWYYWLEPGDRFDLWARSKIDR